MKRTVFYIIALIFIILTISACNKKGDDSSVQESDFSEKSENFDESIEDSSDLSDIGDISKYEISDDEFSSDISENGDVSEPKPSESEVSENEPAGVLTETYIKVFNTGKYRIKIKDLPQKIGDSIVYGDIDCYYKKDGVVIDKEQYGSTERTIILGDDMYSVLDELNKVLKSSVGSFYTDQGLPKLDKLRHYLDGIEEVDGVTYDYESFYDKDGKIITFFYKDGNLKRIRSFIKSVDEYIEYDAAIYSSYDTKIFDLPENYEVITLS